MEVLVVTGREERAKEHYYGEGGVPILSFHIPMMMMMMMMMMMIIMKMMMMMMMVMT